MHDVIIIGGSYAGLAAALQLARARKQVLIIDAGQRRNRFVAHAHGFLGQDGQPPDAIAAKGRSEVLTYPTVTWRDGIATEARSAPDGFVVRVNGELHRGKRLILATGVVDELPAIPGIAERWGKRIFFCPYCDGYEFNMGPLGVLATSAESTHYALIVSEWSKKTTFFLNGVFEPDGEQLAALAAHGVAIERAPVVDVAGDEQTMDLRLADGRAIELDGLFLIPRTRFKTPFAEQLGCELVLGPFGPIYKTDATKETTVRGVFACGDVAVMMPSISFAVADGVLAGAAAHRSLIFGAPSRTS